MRLLHVSDFHFRREWFNWLTKQAGDYDACCFTGDFLDILPNSVSLKSQVKWVQSWLREFPGKLFLCSGNHDFWDPGALEPPGTSYGRWLGAAGATRATVDRGAEDFMGMRFICSPWLGPVADSAVGPVVLLSHAPPDGAGVAIGPNGMFGDDEVTTAAANYAPGSLVLSGHVHRPKQWCGQIGNTWCFNPGMAQAKVPAPNRIVIDTNLRRAERFRHNGFDEPIRLS